MKPSQLATTLRRIAQKIDNSEKPDRTLVVQDLKSILGALSKKAFDDGRIIPGEKIDDPSEELEIKLRHKLQEALENVFNSNANVYTDTPNSNKPGVLFGYDFQIDNRWIRSDEDYEGPYYEEVIPAVQEALPGIEALVEIETPFFRARFIGPGIESGQWHGTSVKVRITVPYTHEI